MKYKYCFSGFLFLIILPIFCFAQSHELADKYWHQALSLDRQNKYLEAARMYEKSAMAEQPISASSLGDLSVKLKYAGNSYYLGGHYDKAIDLFRQALEVDRKLGEEYYVSTDLNNIGLVYQSCGQYDKAIDHFRQALEIHRKLGKEYYISTDLNNIGMVYYSWGQYDKAIDHFRQSLVIDRKFVDEEPVAKHLNNIGLVYQSWGQYDKAIDHFRQALEIHRKLGKENTVAIDLNNIGAVYHSFGKYDKAIDHFRQALEIHRKLGREDQVATQLNNIGAVYRSCGLYDKAIENYRQALAIDRKLGKDAVIAIYLSNIGGVYDSWGQYDKAIKHYLESIKIKEKLRKTAPGDIRRDYLASQIHTYQLLASAYLKNNAPQGVLQSIEQSRAKLLAERIAESESDLSSPSLDKIQKELNNDDAILIFSNIDRDNFILMVITGSGVSMKEINKDSYLAHTKDLYRKPVLSLLDMQRGISIINPKKKEDTQLSKNTENKSKFERSINYYRMLLIQSANESQRGAKYKWAMKNKNPQTNAKDFGRTLYDLLLKPVEETLVGKKRITVIPDGILGFLPFETLVNEQGQYLAERYDIQYAQSMTISNLLDKRHYKENRKPILAFGGAVYDEISYNTEMLQNSTQLVSLKKDVNASFEQNRSLRSAYEKLDMAKWANLPGTLSEVKNISGIVHGTIIITGDEVTENRVKQLSNNGKLAEYKVLHFATHGLVVPALPELSALVLSQFKTAKDENDGYLRMGEIASLNIKADFVNLSACETGLGKIYGGEGVVGLTQSFLIAGANGISVSLWQVADDSTSKFMSELYKKVQEKGIGYSQAIAEVKRGFINGDYGNKWKSPYYWSPFVYYGK